MTIDNTGESTPSSKRCPTKLDALPAAICVDRGVSVQYVDAPRYSLLFQIIRVFVVATGRGPPTLEQHAFELIARERHHLASSSESRTPINMIQTTSFSERPLN